MTRTTHLAATRSNLLRATRRLDQVRRGAALLNRKRQALIADLFARARTAVTSRESIDVHARRAWSLVWLALSSIGSDGLTPLGWPTREIEVELNRVDVWGIRAATLVNRPTLVRSLAARGILPGRGEGSSHEAARAFEALLEQVLDAAPKEHALRRLGQALSQTTRLANTLEQRVAVRLSADVADIQRALSEREREEHLRIKHLIKRRHDQRAAVYDEHHG
jgi:V/A-type H+-transporting ATPase subunit D